MDTYHELDMFDPLNSELGPPFPQSDEFRHITHLAGSDLKIADGAPDILVWRVTGQDGQPIGDVYDLLVDTRHMMAEYIRVRRGENALRRLILPIQMAQRAPAQREWQRFYGVTTP